MCISIPALILSLHDNQAVVSLAGAEKNVLMTVDAQAGDWVLVYGGAALRKLEPKQAEEALLLLQQVNKTSED